MGHEGPGGCRRPPDPDGDAPGTLASDSSREESQPREQATSRCCSPLAATATPVIYSSRSPMPVSFSYLCHRWQGPALRAVGPAAARGPQDPRKRLEGECSAPHRPAVARTGQVPPAASPGVTPHRGPVSDIGAVTPGPWWPWPLGHSQTFLLKRTVTETSSGHAQS